MAQLAAGDRDAFAPLYEALWPLLRRFTGRALPSAADAEDAAQEALVKLFRRAVEFRPDGDAIAWALGIAAHECMTVRRRAWRRGPHVALEGELADPGPTPERAAIARDLDAAAQAALSGLRAADREAILASLRSRRGERAAVAATLRKRLQRALARLRAAWGAKHGTD